MAEIDGAADRKAGKIKLSVTLPEWYDTYKRCSRSGGRPRSQRTIQTDLDTIKQICADNIGATLICDIDSDALQQYFLRLCNDNKSQSTIKKRWHMLAMYFDYYYPDGSGNPMQRCTMPVSQQHSRIMAMDDDCETDTLRAYTDAEQALLAAELSKPYNVHSGWNTGDRGYSCGTCLIVCMYECLRIGEVVELRVKDIIWNADRSSGMIWVRRQYDEPHKIITAPKYGSKRKIPIMAECVDILRAACKGKQPDDLLFTAGNIYNPDKITHEGHILGGRLRDNLSRACERCGLPRHTVHDLRHDGISRLVDLGVKPQSVQRWAGHRSLSVTLDKYYRHSGLEDADDLALITGKADG
ncbi:MAG: site-specific integrase [Clostridiales bacterium]|nr:site-specific integrase [Clostridiales bacterium]